VCQAGSTCLDRATAVTSFYKRGSRQMADVDSNEAARAFDSGWDKPVVDFLLSCTAPIFWCRPSESAPLANGTVFFLDLGRGPSAVTAWHVVAGYREAVEKNGPLRCQIASLVIDPDDRLIGKDLRADVATLQVSASEVREMGKIVHHCPGPWPPPLPSAGKGVFFGGYPGVGRQASGDHVLFNLTAGIQVAESVHEDGLSIQLQRANWVLREYADIPPPGFNWGGISGAPVFALIESSIFYPRIAGVVRECHEEWEVFLVSSLAQIRDDGTIG